MSPYHPSYSSSSTTTVSSAQYSPPSHSSTLSTSSASSSTTSSPIQYSCSCPLHTKLTIDPEAVARYEAAKSFDFEDDVIFNPTISKDVVNKYWEDVTAKSSYYYYHHQQQHQYSLHHQNISSSPPSQTSSPSPTNSLSNPSTPQGHSRIIATDVFRPPSRTRG